MSQARRERRKNDPKKEQLFKRGADPVWLAMTDAEKHEMLCYGLSGTYDSNRHEMIMGYKALKRYQDFQQKMKDKYSLNHPDARASIN